MKAIADENLAALGETFGRHMTVAPRDGRRLLRSDLVDTDVLLVRSVTRVDESLLAGTPVRFVGTATIGTDHLDTDWLDSAGIHWASAPGCNADAAAQYTLGMIALACTRLGRSLEGAEVGIIGRGNVGSRLVTLLEAMGADVVACDPPLEARGVNGLVPLHVALDRDVVSLHVPLTTEGDYPTHHLLNTDTLGAMRQGALLVNAARGGIIDGAALRQALASGDVEAALDTWPEEPQIDAALMSAVRVATPHVAGYSGAGKIRGTEMIYRAWCRFAGQPPWRGPQTAPTHQLSLPGTSPDPVLDAILAVTRVIEDDRQLRERAPVSGTAFDALRRHYRFRREFADIRFQGLPADVAERLGALGFAPPG